MKKASFFIEKGWYDNQTSLSYLYVRPLGLDIRFTVMAILGDQEELDAVVGKVVTDVSFSDTFSSIKLSATRTKTFAFMDGSKSSFGLADTEDVIVLTGQYVEKSYDKDGVAECVIDSVFPLQVCPDGDFDLDQNIGKWVELKIALVLYFETVNDF